MLSQTDNALYAGRGIIIFLKLAIVISLDRARYQTEEILKHVEESSFCIQRSCSCLYRLYCALQIVRLTLHLYAS